MDYLLMNESWASNLAINRRPEGLVRQCQSVSATLDECGGFDSFPTLVESERLTSFDSA